MAFFLTPRFAPAYSCSPYSCAPSPRVIYRQPRPSFPSFVPFLSQVDELLSEFDREARRAAHQARQQRKRAFRAHFNVRQNEQGYEVEGEVPGFEQENIQIEVTDENTLKIAGNTETRVMKPQVEATPAPAEPAPAEEKTAEADTETMDGVTITEADLQGAPTPTGSDTESHKSLQPTVEDDFEDLGAETSSTISAFSQQEPKEPKGKERAVETPASEVPSQSETKPEEDTQQQEEERFRGSFERAFKFPVRIDTANVRAQLKNGVLSVSVPKAPQHQVRQISIQ